MNEPQTGVKHPASCNCRTCQIDRRHTAEILRRAEERGVTALLGAMGGTCRASADGRSLEFVRCSDGRVF